MLKKVLAIHDISCVGKCSLTVCLPIISALGVETNVLPTALLSTHTGGFKDYTYCDLTQELPKILKHFKTLEHSFDSIYSGYLGSYEQIDIVKEYVTYYENATYILDPVMGDNGKLYTNFSNDYPKKMLELVTISDVIIPNITEACLLLGKEYKEDYKYLDLVEIVTKLSELGPKKVILTGITQDNKIGALSYDSSIDKYYCSFTDIVPGYYHGTGDIFSSVICGCLTKGLSLDKAVDKALKFTYNSILNTYNEKTDVKYGVNFEANLGMLIKDYE